MINFSGGTPHQMTMILVLGSLAGVMAWIGSFVIYNFYILPHTLWGKERKFKKLLRKYEKRKGYPYNDKRMFH